MKFELTFQEQDKQKLIAFVQEHQEHVFVKQRKLRNVTGEVPARSRGYYWHTICMCLLTTQQRSNPTSRISKFLLAKPFLISLENCYQNEDVETFILQELTKFGGIRFAPKIADQLKRNLAMLDSKDWETLEQEGNQLEKQRKLEPSPEHYKLEREAALYMQKFNGFGPKQSRNFWQSLGLSRYEFVLDSRIIKWLKERGFPIPLSSMALGEEEYYSFISDNLRKWCVESGILPCIMDAAVFSSQDKEEWPEDATVW